MSLFKVFDVAGSAMSAQSVRLNVISSNLANAESASSSIDKTYRARQPVFATIMDDFEGKFGQESVGVQVLGIVESEAPLRREFQPNHPLADDEGYIHLPNVNAIEEMANMISTRRETSILPRR